MKAYVTWIYHKDGATGYAGADVDFARMPETYSDIVASETELKEHYGYDDCTIMGIYAIKNGGEND